MVLGLSEALASQGVEVTVLTTDANGDAGQPPLAVPLEQPVVQDGYHVYYFRCSPSVATSSRLTCCAGCRARRQTLTLLISMPYSLQSVQGRQRWHGSKASLFAPSLRHP